MREIDYGNPTEKSAYIEYNRQRLDRMERLRPEFGFESSWTQIKMEPLYDGTYHQTVKNESHVFYSTDAPLLDSMKHHAIYSVENELREMTKST